MLKKFNYYCKNLIYARAEEIGREILIKDKRYRELNKEIIEIQHALMDNLPLESRALVFRYDEAEAEQDGILTVEMYRQGFLDGVRCMKIVGKVEKKIGVVS